MPAKPTILITGCSTGIGRAAALALHQRDYRVVASARHDSDLSPLREQGIWAVELDLDSSTSIQNAVAQTLEHTGGQLDALFNNAGYGQYGAIEDLSRETLRRQFETNVFGTQELLNAIVPVMRGQQHGRIIQNSSILGLIALPYRGAYSASKFALEALTDTLRLELRGTGIFVSLIEPGPICSDFGRNAERYFLQNVDTQRGPNAQAYRQVLARLRGDSDSTAGRFRLGPEAVVDKLIHALESRHPKTRYAVTRPAQVFALFRRLLPTALLDHLAARQ